MILSHRLSYFVRLSLHDATSGTCKTTFHLTSQLHFVSPVLLLPYFATFPCALLPSILLYLPHFFLPLTTSLAKLAGAEELFGVSVSVSRFSSLLTVPALLLPRCHGTQTKKSANWVNESSGWKKLRGKRRKERLQG